MFAALAAIAAAITVWVLIPRDTQPSQQLEASTNDAPTGRTEVVEYQAATVYDASTDFYFKDSDGEVIELRASNLPEEQTVELPDDLLDPAVVEGPPGANPDLVGEVPAHLRQRGPTDPS